MNYENAVNYIYSRQKFAKSSGHERMVALLERLGNPQNKLKFVHVVGTNGKGSVSTMISCISREAGYKTGLFTSPFVTEFRERIQIDGSYIEKDVFAEITEQVKEQIEEIEKESLCPTFFETVLATALVYFQKSGCDLVVLEAGIGGKDDSTNIIHAPLVSVITSVSFDHTEVLGNTLEKIAKAKCGIIKSGSSVVSFPVESCGLDFVSQQPEVCEIIKKSCKEKNCRLIFPNIKEIENVQVNIQGSKFDFEGEAYNINLAGDHQIANAVCAVCAARELNEKGLKISSENIKFGLSKAFLPARMEVALTEPLIILDGGHNEGCMAALSKMIEKHLKSKKITAVLGFMKDKDYKSSLKIIAPKCENIVFTLADKNRGEAPAELMKAANGLCQNIICEEDISIAFKKAMEFCDKNEVIICAGSFYLVSEIRNLVVSE